MSDIASSFDDAWAGFQARVSLKLVGDTMEWEWTRGRAQYLAFLIRVDGPAVREHIAAIAERLTDIPGVEVYPDWYWHVTVKGAGFQVIERTHDDDVLRQDVPRIAGKARALISRQGVIEVRVGLVNAFAEVVFIEILDEGRIRDLNALLADGLPDIARYPVDGDGFLPHVSIARFTSGEGLPQLKERLADLRAEGPGPSFRVGHVEFVKAWLSEEIPEFETIAAYPLRTSS